MRQLITSNIPTKEAGQMVPSSATTPGFSFPFSPCLTNFMIGSSHKIKFVNSLMIMAYCLFACKLLDTKIV